MELLRNPNSRQLLPLLAVVGGPGGLGTGPWGRGPACCGCIILPTSQPTLLYLLAKTPQDAMRLPPPPWMGLPCLSGKASVSSSLENCQVPAGTWEEDAGFERRAGALRSVASASGRALPRRPSICPACLPPHLPLAAWPSLGRLPQPQTLDTARNVPPGAAVA